jgi:hypothetical protein
MIDYNVPGVALYTGDVVYDDKHVSRPVEGNKLGYVSMSLAETNHHIIYAADPAYDIIQDEVLHDRFVVDRTLRGQPLARALAEYASDGLPTTMALELLGQQPWEAGSTDIYFERVNLARTRAGMDVLAHSKSWMLPMH